MTDQGKTSRRGLRGLDRAVFHVAGFPITKRLLVKFALALVVIAVLAWVYQRIDPAEFQAEAREWPAPVIIGTIVLLPMVGFPVSWLHLVAGFCFGFGWGLVVVLVTTIIHHVAGWALVRVLPRHTFKRFDHWEEKLAGAGHRDATLLGGLIPGMPYVVHLYVLPIIGTPLLMLSTLGVAIHTARAFVTILLGDQSGDLTPGRIAALAVYYAVIVALCAWALHGLRRRLKNGQTKPAAGSKDASVSLAPCTPPPRS